MRRDQIAPHALGYVEIPFSSCHAGVAQFQLQRLQWIRRADVLKIREPLDGVGVAEHVRPDVQACSFAVRREYLVDRRRFERSPCATHKHCAGTLRDARALAFHLDVSMH